MSRATKLSKFRDLWKSMNSWSCEVFIRFTIRVCSLTFVLCRGYSVARRHTWAAACQQPAGQGGAAQQDEKLRPVAVAEEIERLLDRLIGLAARRCAQDADNLVEYRMRELRVLVEQRKREGQWLSQIVGGFDRQRGHYLRRRLRPGCRLRSGRGGNGLRGIR